MTCIAWDGRTLAADTRISTPHERRNDSAKIHQFKEVILMGGHRVLAVGTSGNAALSRQVIGAIRDNPEQAELIVPIFQNAWNYGQQSDDRTCSLLIVCEDTLQIFQIRYKNGKRNTRLRQHSLASKMAVGSGGNVAEFVMSHFAIPAPLAVASASTVDEATGSFVQSIDIDGTKISAKTEQHFNKSEMVVKHVRDHIVKGVAPCPTQRKRPPSKPRSTKR